MLNWNIEVILDLIFSLLSLIIAIISYISPKTKKITSLFYIRLGFLFIGLFIFLDGIAILFISEIFSRISAIILFPFVLSIAIGVNYIFKENFYSFGLLLICSLGSLLVYFGFHPDATRISIGIGYPRIQWIGFFNVISILFIAIAFFYLLYWGTRTYINAPFLIKREARLLFSSVLITSVGGLFFYLLCLINPIYILFSNLSIIIGFIIFIIAIIRAPKLLYIFPFTVYRILVKNRNGVPLFDHDWSQSNISENIFTGFINAVQLMSEEVMHIGGLLDINLEEGILILKESERITVGLVSSKSSKLLRDSVVSFTNDFEKKFDHELKSSIIDKSAYDSAYELIEKHFSNFPSKVIKSNKQPLLLTGKYSKIPLDLGNKLRDIFKDEKEYNTLKVELLKSPLSIPPEFLKSYKEMQEELQLLSEKEVKFLDNESELDD